MFCQVVNPSIVCIVKSLFISLFLFFIKGVRWTMNTITQVEREAVSSKYPKTLRNSSLLSIISMTWLQLQFLKELDYTASQCSGWRRFVSHLYPRHPNLSHWAYPHGSPFLNVALGNVIILVPIQRNSQTVQNMRIPCSCSQDARNTGCMIPALLSDHSCGMDFRARHMGRRRRCWRYIGAVGS